MRQFQFQGLKECFMVSPWMTEKEFVLVAELVGSEEFSDLRQAQERLLVWKIRQGRRLQDILDITLCILTDLLSLNNEKALSGADQQTVLNSASLTIARFVNLMTDGSLTDKLERASVLQLASKIGIPEWMVDIRHEVVHRRLPCKAFATTALLFAKDYVHEKFWSLLCNRSVELSSSELHHHIWSVLRDNDVAAGEKRDNLFNLLSYKKYPSLYTVMEGIVDYLLEVGDSSFMSEEQKLSADVIERVTPAIDAVRKCGLLDQLIERLLCREERAKACSDWILYLVSGFYSKDEDRDRVANDILNKFLLNPELTTAVQRFLSLWNRDHCMLSKLTDLYQGEVEPLESTEELIVHSVDDLPCLQRDKQTDNVHLDVSLTSKWRKSTDLAWKTTPLGMLPEDITGTYNQLTYTDMQEEGKDNSTSSEANTSATTWSDCEMNRIKSCIVTL